MGSTVVFKRRSVQKFTKEKEVIIHWLLSKYCTKFKKNQNKRSDPTCSHVLVPHGTMYSLGIAIYKDMKSVSFYRVKTYEFKDHI